MQVEQLVREYLTGSRTHMLQLATAADNQPWLCNVWFAVDESLNVYWFSANNRRHSLEIAKNPKVAGAVCDPQGPDDTPAAVQFQGIAVELTDNDDILKARSVYEGRVFDAATVDKLIANPEKPHRFYKVTPELFVLFDAVNFPEVSRQEWRPNQS